MDTGTRMRTATFVMLGLAIAMAWLPHRWAVALPRDRARIAPWHPCLAACLILGLASGVIQPVGMAWVALMWVAGAWHDRAPGRLWPALLFGGLTLAAALHALPGFRNLPLIDAVALRPDALPFTLYANMDKGLAGLFLMAFAGRPADTALDGVRLCGEVALHALWIAGLMLGLAWAMGIVRFDPAWVSAPSPWEGPAWRFLLVNLLFTCVAEEAFFRGLVQGGLTRWLTRAGRPAWPAVAAAALLFGLAHAGGGWAYAGLAALAGLGYGLVRERTGRVGAAVAAHFALNAAHFLLFTYPMRA